MNVSTKNSYSLHKLFNLSFVLAFCLVFAGVVSAWTGPTATAPANNATAPVNVGATSQVKSGGLGVASLLSTGEVVGTIQGGYGQFRMVAGNYGSFWRQDGATTYLLLTAVGDQYGVWNSLRPFYVDDATGNVTIGTQVTAPKYCIGASCITTWPSGSAAGPHMTIYSSSAVITNGAIVFSGAVNSAAYLSGTTIVLPSNTVYYTVELWAGGYGGSGSGSGGSGSAGGSSCFSTSASPCTSPIMRSVSGGTATGGDINITNGLMGGYTFGVNGSSSYVTTNLNSPYAKKVAYGTGTTYYTVGAGGAAGCGSGQGSTCGTAGGPGGIIITAYQN